MPRLFTGLEIPEALADDLARLRGGIAGARWVEQIDYHLTLRFIGDVDDRTANEIADLLAVVRRRAFDVTLTGLDSFGGDRPRSVFADIRATPQLIELQAEHERIMRRIGLAPEPRKFRPHVTLARMGRETSARNVADWIALRGLFMSRSFQAARFVLFSSRDSVGGGPYIVEEAYPLSVAVPAFSGGEARFS